MVPNALPGARYKANGGPVASQACWGEVGIHFEVSGLASDEDVHSALSVPQTETSGCASAATGRLDPTRQRVLTGWGGNRDSAPLRAATRNDRSAGLGGSMSLHSPNPDGNTAPDGSRINAPFNCAVGCRVVRSEVVLEHAVEHLRVLDRAPGNQDDVGGRRPWPVRQDARRLPLLTAAAAASPGIGRAAPAPARLLRLQ